MAPIGSKGVLNTMVNNNTYVKPRKVSIDACVQTPSCFDDTNPVSPNRSSSNERYRNLKNPKEEPIKTLQPKQTETRRWSSYLPGSKPEKPTITSKLTQLSNRNRLSTGNITRAEPTTADMNKKSSNATQMNRAPLLSGVKSKPETKRNSTAGVYNNNRNSLRKNSQEELAPVYVPAGRREPTIAHHYEKSDSDVYLQRRLSLMINTDEQTTPVVKEQPQQQQRREIPVSRYSYKQVSTRAKEALKPIKSEQPQKSIFSSRSRPAPTEPKPIKDVSATKQPERSVFNPRRHLIHRTDELVSSPDVNENRGHVDQLKHSSNDTARRASYRDRILSYKEPVTTTATVTATATVKPSYSVSKRLSSSALPTPSVPASSIPAPSTSRAVPTISTQLRRARSLTVPSSRYGHKDSDANVSSMPVPIFRHRKQASNYASVPEDKVAPPPPPSPPAAVVVASAPVATSLAKVVRFSFPSRRISKNDVQLVSYSGSDSSNTTAPSSRTGDVDSLPSTSAAAPVVAATAATSPANGVRLSFPIRRSSNNDIQLVPAYNSSGHSNTTASSSRSDHVDSMPSKPAAAAATTSTAKGVRFSYPRRISNNDIQPVPSYSSSGNSNTTTSSSRSDDVDSIPSTPPDRVKSGFLNRARETYDSSIYQRQRVLSEDNHQYKNKQKKSVTESAREVLAHVQERRAKNAVILNSVHHR